MLSRTSSEMVARPLELGEQTNEVLAEFGFTKDEIGALRKSKVV
jgi:crotonobetainyl-CoA:carnitine CoA-transferase CaiB-like acyl-CoA transferase